MRLPRIVTQALAPTLAAAAVLAGAPTPGPHLLSVEVVLDGGEVLQRTVEYVGLLNQEP